jgi:DNA polymerase III subunit epsilon
VLSSLFSPEFRRKRLLKRLKPGPLHDFYAVPFPSPRSDCRTLEFVALDLETTGLDPNKDAILSLGWVVIKAMQVDLASAQHRLVKPFIAIPEQSAVIHHITDDQAAEGESLRDVLEELLKLMAGKVLIAHHAKVEVGFLRKACEHYCGDGFMMRVIDTQEVARRSLQMRDQVIRSGDMRLPELRERYHLPRYRLHNALSDALAAAELFLAQLAQYDTSKAVPLNNFLLKV